MSWFSVDRQVRFLQQIVGEQVIARLNRRGPDQATHLPAEVDLPEEERHAAVEREAERREHEES
jgi:hypothetical protein